MNRPLRVLGLAALLSLAVPSVAEACGGCFAPPQTVQVVTDHRMVLALSANQTTLWDQFRYTGRPQDFSWILPIRYTERTRIALASNDFLTAADELTAPVIVPPRVVPPTDCQFAPSAGGSFDASNSAADAGSVQVLREEVIGPYAVSVIRGSDPMAIRNWLRDNGYSVPPAVSPVIDFYTQMSMDYVALRLRPGEGVDRMSPVRVTFDGNVPRLPLRMIAAGVADKVALSLIVIAPSRIEADNFPNGQLREEDFVWDWAASPSGSRLWISAFDALNNTNGGRLWLTESSIAQARTQWSSYVQSRFQFARDAGVVSVDAGGVAPSADAQDDVAMAFEPIGANAQVTRLRADLLGRMLDRDLVLRASDLGERSRQYNITQQRNPPTFPGCMPRDAGTTSRPDASVTLDGGTDPVPMESSGGASCAVSPLQGERGAKLPALFAFGLLVGASWRLSRRRR